MSPPGGDRLDLEARVLGWFIALMPAHRREWGEAMRADRPVSHRRRRCAMDVCSGMRLGDVPYACAEG